MQDRLEAYASATALVSDAKEMIKKYPDSVIWTLCGYDPEQINAKM